MRSVTSSYSAELLNLADQVSDSGFIDLEESLKAYFSKQEILEWYAYSKVLKVLSGHDKFIKGLSKIFEDPTSESLSNFISTEQDRINLEIACTEHLLESHIEAEEALFQKAKIIKIRAAANDFGAINPDIVVDIIQDQVEAFLTEQCEFIVFMKNKNPLLDGIRTMKNSGSYGHLFR